MSREQLELRYLVNDMNFVIFDFPYKLFDDTLKEEFETLFCEYFYFREIGHETIGRFKFELKNKLDMLYPYYKEYYKTCKQVEIEKFMETKDLKETFTRTVENTGEVESQSNQNSTNNSTNKNINKFSDTPIGNVTEINNFITNATTDENNNNSTNTLSGTDKQTQNGKTIEKTEFTSVGDLGVTSSGLLITGWREVITNIYQLMFDDMEELFFGLCGSI